MAAKVLSAALMADAWNDFTDVVSATVALIAVGLTLSDPCVFAPPTITAASSSG